MGARAHPSGREWALLLALCALLFFLGLGALGLTDRDEGSNAEAAREMVASGDWITPTLNGAPRFAKPILPTQDGVLASLSSKHLPKLRGAVVCKPFRHSDQSLPITSDSLRISSQRLWDPQPCLELTHYTVAVDAARPVECSLVAVCDCVE